jgi:putative flippase GtrA
MLPQTTGAETTGEGHYGGGVTSPPASPPAQRRSRRGLLGTAMRYLGGSVVATVCSEVAFVVLYGPLHVGPTWSSVVGWLAGALPNYWLNRAWAWRRTGRPSVRHELLPYAAIILFTLVLAILTTKGVDHLMRAHDTASGLRVGTVAVVFLGVYVVVFVARFFLLDRLFLRLRTREAADRVPGGTS